MTSGSLAVGFRAREFPDGIVSMRTSRKDLVKALDAVVGGVPPYEPRQSGFGTGRAGGDGTGSDGAVLNGMMCFSMCILSEPVTSIVMSTVGRLPEVNVSVSRARAPLIHV